MAQLDDLFTALNIFKTGVNQFQTAQSIDKANQQVAQIRASDQSEAKKRQQLQDLSSGLTAQLAAQGTPATTIQAVQGAIGPQQFTTADQAILAGVIGGKPELVQQGREAAAISKEDEIGVRKEQQDFQKRENELNRENSRILAGIKSTGKNKLPATEVDKISASDSKLSTWQQLASDLEAHPKWSGNQFEIPGSETIYGKIDPEWAAWKSSLMNQYFAIRKDITGVAGSQKEYAEIQRNQPSLKDPAPILLAKIKSVEKNYEKIRATQLSNFSKAGYDVGAFLPSGSKDTKASTSNVGSPISSQTLEQHDALAQLPPNSKFLGVALKDGKRVNVYQLPNGRKVVR